MNAPALTTPADAPTRGVVPAPVLAIRLDRAQYAALVPIPAEQLAAFHGVPLDAQQKVERWRPIVGEVRHVAAVKCEGVREAFVRVAEEQTTGDFPVTPGQVKKLYYAVAAAMREGGVGNGWRGLLDARHLKRGFCALHPDFLDWWHDEVGMHQRNTARAYRSLLEKYHAGETIPGLPSPAERTARLPAGMSKKSLTRAYNMPSDAALKLARHGFADMKRALPTGPMDISEVRPLEYIVCDDVKLDFLVSVAGVKKPVKLRLIVMMDLCSRMILSIIVRPGIERADGTEDGLKLTDMKAAIAHLLRTWGVPEAYPMTLVCERGTAAVPDADKAALAEMSDGRIRVSDTSMIVGRVFDFADRSTGNSWGKAWLESNFNLLHNELQAVRGQVGRRYDLQPAEIHGRTLALRDVEWLAERLPGAQFTRPFLNIGEARQAITDALARMHARQDHKLLYFGEVGMWRAHESQAFLPEHELPEPMRAIAASLEWRSAKESPKMRFVRLLPLAGELIAIPESALQRLMDSRRRERWDGHAFTFELDRVKFTCIPSDQMRAVMVPKRHYILWFHPQQMEHIYVTRDLADGGGYVGEVTRYTAGKYGDVEDMQRYIAEGKRRMADVAQRVRQAGLARGRKGADDLHANAEAAERELANVQAASGEMVVIGPDGKAVRTTEAAGLAPITTARAEEARRKRDLPTTGDTLAQLAAMHPDQDDE